MSAIGTAYGKDLCPKGILCLSQADVATMLLSFFFLPLSLGFGLFCFNLGFFSLISKPLSFLQLFPQNCQLLLNSSQLIIGLTY